MNYINREEGSGPAKGGKNAVIKLVKAREESTQAASMGGEGTWQLEMTMTMTMELKRQAPSVIWWVIVLN